MPRRALYVGIDVYDTFKKLPGCTDDARELSELLATHHNNGPNYAVRLRPSLKVSNLRNEITQFFAGPFEGDVLFYFSGHGAIDGGEPFLVASDGQQGNLGYPMNHLLTQARQALHSCRSVTLILDCCHAGAAGAAPVSPYDLVPTAQLPLGVTFIAAARAEQAAVMANGRSAFSQILQRALRGGAADPRGRVSSAAAYAFIESSFGPFDQRPVYKSHETTSTALRYCQPSVSDQEIRELPQYFPNIDSILHLDPSFESHCLAPGITPKFDGDDALAPHVRDPNKNNLRLLMVRFRNCAMLQPVWITDPRPAAAQNPLDLFWACVYSQGVKLTGLGQYYWTLVKDGRI